MLYLQAKCLKLDSGGKKKSFLTSFFPGRGRVFGAEHPKAPPAYTRSSQLSVLPGEKLIYFDLVKIFLNSQPYFHLSPITFESNVIMRQA